MSTSDSFPLGQPAFVTHVLDRAAHLRSNDEKLFALEGHREARAYVIYRDSLVVKQEDGGARALLSLDEARSYGANPGTIFLGLRDAAPIFGMGIAPQAAEKLVEAGRILAQEPQAMQLRYFAALHDIAGERSSTVVFPLPMNLLDHLTRRSEAT